MSKLTELQLEQVTGGASAVEYGNIFAVVLVLAPQALPGITVAADNLP